MVQWAKENAQASSLADRPVRWLVDDCLKFVQREQRRGNVYDGIIMDPPSYGRGPGGEVWKLEEQLYGLVEQCVPILSEQPLFFLLNSYTTGLSPSVMAYLLGLLLKPRFGGEVSADEIGLPVTATGLTLPCGSNRHLGACPDWPVKIPPQRALRGACPRWAGKSLRKGRSGILGGVTEPGAVEGDEKFLIFSCAPAGACAGQAKPLSVRFAHSPGVFGDGFSNLGRGKLRD